MPLLLEQEPKIAISWISPPVTDLFWEKLSQIGLAPAVLMIETGTMLLAPGRIGHLNVERREDATRWYLHLGQRPAGDPPAAVQEQTDRVGGVSGLRALLAEGWESGLPPPADFRISVVLPKPRWECLVIPALPLPFDPCLRLDADAKVEQIGYRFNGPLGLREVVIIYYHDVDKYTLRCNARGLVELSDDLALPYVDSVLGLAINSFFRDRHAK